MVWAVPRVGVPLPLVLLLHENGVERLLRVPILHWSETVEAEPGDWSLRAHLVCSASLRLCAKHDELPPLTARG